MCLDQSHVLVAVMVSPSSSLSMLVRLQVLLMVSHELNTPLHEVLGCLDALISAEGSNALPGGTRPFAETAKMSAMQVRSLLGRARDQDVTLLEDLYIASCCVDCKWTEDTCVCSS